MKLFKQLLVIILLMTFYYLCFNTDLHEQTQKQQSGTAIYPEEALSTTLKVAPESGQTQITPAGQMDGQPDQTPEASGGEFQQGFVDMAAGGAKEHTAVNKAEAKVEIPILLYHHIAEEANGSITISERTFLSHLEAIDSAGYNTIFFEELIAYVEEGAELPEKPLIITFDDGYLSNYEIAYQILGETGMKATIFPIGVSLGKDLHRHDTAFWGG